MKHLRCLFLLFAVLFTSAILQAGEPTIHVILAVDGRAGFAGNLVADYNNMERLFKENVPASRLNFVGMNKSDITPDTILKEVSKINLAEGDTLVLYYSGHAAHDATNGGQYFQLKDAKGEAATLLRHKLLDKMKDKNARLVVLLTDCCNIVQKLTEAVESKDIPRVAKSPEEMSPIFEALFVKPAGVVNITSSKKGEASFVDSTSEKRGSCFTWPMVALFDTHRSDAEMTWEKFIPLLKTDVQKAFKECFPEGHSHPEINNGITQKTQTVEVYGLPGENVGPRFGVRAVTHSGGVCVTEIVPGGPGDRAGFEIGDIIVEINTAKIRNEDDYSQAVDDSLQEMNVKVINNRDGKILETTVKLGY